MQWLLTVLLTILMINCARAQPLPGPGITSFIKLIDTPASYDSANGQCLLVDETNKRVVFGSCSGTPGSPIILDLGDDDNDESTDLLEIAVDNDANGIFSEPSNNKLLIDLANAVPLADALSADGANCSAGEYARGVDVAGAAQSCTADDDTTEILTSGSDADSSTAGADGGLEYVGGLLSLLRGCGDGEGLVWNETSDTWECGPLGNEDLSDNSITDLLDIADFTAVEGDLLYFDGSEWVTLNIGADGTFLMSDGTTASWGTVTDDLSDNSISDLDDVGAMTEESGDVLYFDGSVWNRLAKGSDGQVLKLASGLPSWAADSTSGTLTLDQAFDGGKEIDGADSEANALIVGDGTDGFKFYVDATDGPIIRCFEGAEECNQVVNIPAGKSLTIQYDGTTGQTIDDAGAITLANNMRQWKTILLYPAAAAVSGCTAEQLTVDGLPQWGVRCTDSDSATMVWDVTIPHGWDEPDPIKFTGYARYIGASPANDYDIDWAVACAGNSEGFTFGDEVPMDFDFDGGSYAQYEMAIVGPTDDAFNGPEICGEGDIFRIRAQIDATGTTATVADVFLIQFFLNYRIISPSDD